MGLRLLRISALKEGSSREDGGIPFRSIRAILVPDLRELWECSTRISLARDRVEDEDAYEEDLPLILFTHQHTDEEYGPGRGNRASQRPFV